MCSPNKISTVYNSINRRFALINSGFDLITFPINATGVLARAVEPVHNTPSSEL